MREESKLILVSPTSINGAPGRILTYPDGTIVVQVWDGSTWVNDKSRVVADKPESEEPGAQTSPPGDKPSTSS